MPGENGPRRKVVLYNPKAARPDLPIVWGGWHPSLFGAECFEEPAVDVTVQAQGDYSLLPVEKYFGLKGKRQIDYVSSQGCHFRCAFCADPFVFGRSWAGLDPARMGEEIEALWKRHRFDDVNFRRASTWRGSFAP